ncbi:hypothetical protein PIB30_050134 [Stylosanthes scabra]|uniref:Uncharacterized protein n=1 Tax=Stylosanthes scabra TaxID=79078 RepID=A0ABU6VFK0_9FABA|nr:hypothetical protein [Stylosanthes scabra]
MVSIQSQHTIIPSSPTPNGKLFSLCEQTKLRTHAPLLYAYGNASLRSSLSPSSTLNCHVFHTLMISLGKALSIYYPLAGRLRFIDGSRWEINCNAKGALLIDAFCNGKSMYDFCGDDFLPTGLVSQLMPKIDYDAPLDDTPFLVVQVTRFNCGGFTIGVAMCRAVIDGMATIRFMNTWAKLARGESLDPSERFPCYDPSLLNSRALLPSKNVNNLHEHHLDIFGTPPPWLGTFRQDSRVAVQVVKLTKEQVNKLKMKAAIENGKSAPFSSFEIIAAILWRCVTKARYQGKGDQPTRLTTLVNCRNRLKPPLPDNYSGNAVFPTVTTCSFTDLMQNPLSSTVGKVKDAIARVDDRFVREALVCIRNTKDMDLVRYNVHYPAKSVLKGAFKGNPNLFIVSWMNFSYKFLDFGFGEPVHFGPGYMDSEGKAFVTNNVSGDGFNVAIALDSSHMDAFKKFFYEEIIQEVFVPISKL